MSVIYYLQEISAVHFLPTEVWDIIITYIRRINILNADANHSTIKRLMDSHSKDVANSEFRFLAWKIADNICQRNVPVGGFSHSSEIRRLSQQPSIKTISRTVNQLYKCTYDAIRHGQSVSIYNPDTDDFDSVIVDVPYCTTCARFNSKVTMVDMIRRLADMATMLDKHIMTATDD